VLTDGRAQERALARLFDGYNSYSCSVDKFTIFLRAYKGNLFIFN